MWADLSQQLWFFATLVSTQVGTKKSSQTVPVLAYVLSEAKKENTHFTQYFRLPWKETCDLMYAWWWQSLKPCTSPPSALWTELAGTSSSFGNITLWTHPAGKVLQIKICKIPLREQYPRAATVTSFSFSLNFYKFYAIYYKNELWSGDLTEGACRSHTPFPSITLVSPPFQYLP